MKRFDTECRRRDENKNKNVEKSAEYGGDYVGDGEKHSSSKMVAATSVRHNRIVTIHL